VPPIHREAAAELPEPTISTVPAGQSRPDIPENLNSEKASASVFTVASLLSEFTADNDATVKRLKGQVLTVRDKIEKTGKHDLTLKTASDRDSVKCSMPKGVDAPTVPAGEVTIVRGTFRGRRFTGTIILSECEVIATTGDL